MKIQLTRSCKIEGVWRNPGSIVEIADKDASRLLTLKAAERLVEITTEDDVVTDDESAEAIEDLAQIDGVSSELAEILYEAGYKTIQQVAEAEPEDLIRLKGVGKKSVEKIQDSAEELLELSEDDDDNGDEGEN